MKSNQRFAAIFSAIIACVMVCSLLLLSPENSWARVSPGQEIPQVSPRQEIPNNGYEIPANPSPTGLRTQAIGEFAWKTFVALNWPAECDGSPAKEIIGEAPEKPRVWEFYNFPEDVFGPDGQKTNPKKVIPFKCNESPTPTPHPAHLSEFGSNPIFTKLALNETSEDQQRIDAFQKAILALNKTSEDEPRIDALQKTDCPPGLCLAGGFVLVDPAGNYVINESRMNPAEVDQIVNNGWYSADNLKKFDNDISGNPFQLLCSSQTPGGTYPNPNSPGQKVPCRENGGKSGAVNTSMGAIEIKAAWMVLPDSPDPNNLSRPLPDPAKYYTTKLTFNVSKDTTVTVPVALIGFHIVHKTSQTGWVWSTFEHIDNAPLDDDTKKDDSPYYNLYDSRFPERQKNEPLAQPPYLWSETSPHAVTTNNKPQPPSQITRQVPIPSFAQKLNTKWQEKLNGDNSPWKNYQLIGIQWLPSPESPYQAGATVIPEKLANVTLEPYPQKFADSQKFGKYQNKEIGYSCVGCHQTATLQENASDNVYSDFSFLMSHAK